ncbi:hypothetical protein FACS1894199_09480 [Bacteroidia bacterium]|nr:hypothetical protein FACS1894199_09480 [Bacteroidia bacterium]
MKNTVLYSWRKIGGLAVSLAILLFTFAACQEDDETTKKAAQNIDKTLLYGKWKNNNKTGEYWKYESNNTGSTWDESEDVHEDEAQAFRWTLSGSELKQFHKMESGEAEIPKGEYTITTLSASSLKYKDKFKSYSFTKVE